MRGVRVKVVGLEELRRDLSDPGLLDAALRPGFEKAGVVVEGAWKDKAHEVTRKYKGSLGHELTGRGADLQAVIGPQPGTGQARGYTKAQTGHWKKPRSGKNKGDPQVYAIYEDQGTRYRPGHPAAEPALLDNADRVERFINDGVNAALEKVGR